MAKAKKTRRPNRPGDGAVAATDRPKRRRRKPRSSRLPAGSAGSRLAEELTRSTESSHESAVARKPGAKGAGSAKAKPAKAKPAKAKPVKAKPAKAKPARANPAKPAKAKPARVKPAKAKPAKAKPAKAKSTGPAKPVKAKAPRPRPVTAAAERARRRRAEERGIRDQLEHEREERERLRAAQRREKKLGIPPDPLRLAVSWLREIRNAIASVARCLLDLTRPESGARTPWLVVGKIDFVEAIDYRTLAEAIRRLRDDLTLEATIGPQRLSQIRVVYRDPRGRRGEGDSIVSKTGAWEFVVSDMLGELVGAGPDDEDSLAVRYAETVVPTVYFYFAADIVPYTTPTFWKRV